ncbi:hypothetical protein ACH518_08885 [Methylomonas sp. HW2-6]|uniref:hypothetical protein n=1 Tax=Methylomonas sp. HW2-6 TaxID=3376687 RepID=UPI00404117F2
MAELFFISKALALQIHRQQIERFGGALGIRDEALLASALGAARQTWHYCGDIFQIAAQYCYSLANQKRPTMDNDQLYDWGINTATQQVSREELADFLKQHCA